MSPLSRQDKDLVLWVLNQSYPSLEHSHEDDLSDPFVVKLSLEQIRSLSNLLRAQMTLIEEDISRCMSDASNYVLERHHDTLESISSCLDRAKPLVSTPAAHAPVAVPE